MPIEKKHTGKRFVDYVGEIAYKKRIAAIQSLSNIGIKCVAEARENGSYTDRTGNLRSSIGYCIIDNGVIIDKAIASPKIVKPGIIKDRHGREIKIGGNGKDGTKSSNDLLNDIALEYPVGLVLIVVAGMNYAAAVEAKEFNVLDSARTEGEKLVEEMIKQLGIKRR